MQLWVGASLEEGLFVCLFTFKMVLDYLKIAIPFVLSRLPLLPVPLSCFFSSLCPFTIFLLPASAPHILSQTRLLFPL